MQYWLLFSFLVLGVHAEEVCYPPCGCFHDDPPFDDRPLPNDIESQEFEFRLYTRDNPEEPIYIHWEDDELPDEYNSTVPTYWMIHGWWVSGPNPPDALLEAILEYGDYPATPYSDYGFSDIRRALLNKYECNVIQMYWRGGAGYLYYPQSASNAQVAGACAAYFALEMQDADLVHCIGHSLGGQVCGYMGWWTNGTMGRLTGLDPAGPMFDKEEPEIRIDKTDALFVDNIYTNVNESFVTLGLGKPVGHVDFWPNGGGRQPGCLYPGCDHDMGLDYYHASVDTDCLFLSYPCQSHEDAWMGLCTECDEETDCQMMGHYAPTMPGNGTFFLTTVEDYPHCNP